MRKGGAMEVNDKSISVSGLEFQLVTSAQDELRLPLRVGEKTRAKVVFKVPHELHIVMDVDVIPSGENGARAVISEEGNHAKSVFLTKLTNAWEKLTDEEAEDVIERISSELTRRLVKMKPEIQQKTDT